MVTRLSKAYLLTKVLTASKSEIITYLYEGAINYLGRAIRDLREGDQADAGEAIERTISIIVELSGSLDYANGGQLTLRLDAIYNYLIESLTLAAGKGDVEALESCRSILAILHDAWEQAMDSMGEKAAQPAEGSLQISA